MAKKAKVRKGAKQKEEKEGQTLGTVAVGTMAYVNVTSAATFNELVIEWACLGLSEEPDAIVETSGASVMLDKKRLPRTDEDGLHIYFDPAVAGGQYAFQFRFIYNEAVEARTFSPADAPTDEELQKEHDKEAA